MSLGWLFYSTTAGQTLEDYTSFKNGFNLFSVSCLGFRDLSKVSRVLQPKHMHTCWVQFVFSVKIKLWSNCGEKGLKKHSFSIERFVI